MYLQCYLGDLWEDPVHGVLPGVEVQLGLGEHVAAELRELEPEEEVGEVDLAENVHQVQHLAEHELHEVGASSRWPAKCANNYNVSSLILDEFELSKIPFSVSSLVLNLQCIYSLDVVIFRDELHAVPPGALVHEGRDVGEAARDDLHHPALRSLPQQPV